MPVFRERAAERSSLASCVTASQWYVFALFFSCIYSRHSKPLEHRHSLICCRSPSDSPGIYCWSIFRSKLQYQFLSKVNSINLLCRWNGWENRQRMFQGFVFALINLENGKYFWEIIANCDQTVHKRCIMCNTAQILLAKHLCLRPMGNLWLNCRITGLLNMWIKTEAQSCNSDQICFLFCFCRIQ